MESSLPEIVEALALANLALIAVWLWWEGLGYLARRQLDPGKDGE